MPNLQVSLDRIFQALADPTRREIVERLIVGPASVSELARPFAMSLPALMQHLQVLEGSGLIHSQKVGRVRTCRVEPYMLRLAEDWITTQRTLCVQSLDRLDDHLAKSPNPPINRRSTMMDMTVLHGVFASERAYDCSVAEVFHAWTDPDAKARWFADPDAEHELDLRVGGRETLRTRRGDGSVLTFESIYQDVVPGERLVYTSTLSQGQTPLTVSVTSVEFAETDSGSRLLLTESGAFLDGLEEPNLRAQGTGTWLDALETELQRGADSSG
jgi:uncharacterized protein YndB with AHSA1/START domain/DNA-binding HxlR family transcriptional regulator